ncbi:MAG: hypothetical protein A2087_02585 [Spirochaetes bacterium GWD1_61_31]|nr:MAG: hypothetical protein A2Y37_09705 [Spirochaetes bacterium GWB1_60_80]OHD42403.1 MAG: hypothetical protein A2087_02585 [Spirochaetes bacterium GWD1_61_31]HAX36437.1 hypothetical protein [Spirochaetaceae bacterium]
MLSDLEMWMVPALLVDIPDFMESLPMRCLQSVMDVERLRALNLEKGIFMGLCGGLGWTFGGIGVACLAGGIASIGNDWADMLFGTAIGLGAGAVVSVLVFNQVNDAYNRQLAEIYQEYADAMLAAGD